MRNRAGALKYIDHETSFGKPPPGIAHGACWTEGSRGPQYRHVGICAVQLTSDGELANQPAARSQTPRDLS